ncbi:MAG: HEAT repeat domain-containing protein [Myxococcota bacterium]|nr:HEAT repeat domain-containing protein [Myxococcota bacterium]
MRATITALAVLLVAASASAQTGPSRQRVRELLSGIEDVPTDADWQRIGDGALPVLIDLYVDADEAPYVRLRAVNATAAFPREATRTFLLAVARAEGQGDLFVRQAVIALARGFGEHAVQDLRPFLAHDEVVVREATARALGEIGGPQATAALRARLSVERDRAVREAIQGGLR